MRGPDADRPSELYYGISSAEDGYSETSRPLDDGTKLGILRGLLCSATGAAQRVERIDHRGQDTRRRTDSGFEDSDDVVNQSGHCISNRNVDEVQLDKSVGSLNRSENGLSAAVSHSDQAEDRPKERPEQISE